MSKDIEDIKPIDNKKYKLTNFVKDLLNSTFNDDKTYERAVRILMRKYKISPKKHDLQMIYHKLLDEKVISRNLEYEKWGIGKKIRSSSGVLPVTVFTAKMWKDEKDGKTNRFDCAYDCHYCPDEPGQPRSYLSTEPGVMRAIENDYDAIRQFDARMMQLVSCGHVPDKIEILVLGGTWSSYPMEYREGFIRDIYYAANTWERKFINPKDPRKREREPDTLLAERHMNEDTSSRIIGVTLETRPDQINRREMQHFRDCGCTRVQLGIQHVDDEILRKINRQCYLKHSIRAIRMLKEAGFKVDIHLMPDLPGSSIEKDIKMFDYVLNSPDIQADQWKIYPTAVTPFTKIEDWYNDGSYKPYAETDFDGFMQMLIDTMAKVHPWIRLNRVIRDIPERSMLGGYGIANLRNLIDKQMKELNLRCRCIRAREIRDSNKADHSKAKLTIREYKASDGIEHYISFEDPETEDLYGHLRLRINSDPENNKYFPELSGCGLIRELHVYGKLVSISDVTKYKDRAQHHGLGTKLLEEAERITKEVYKLEKIAVIAGDGVKPYYRKKGYRDIGHYLVKDISEKIEIKNIANQRMKNSIFPRNKQDILCIYIFIISLLTLIMLYQIHQSI